MDSKERAKRFFLARTGLNQNGEETKAKVYELTGVPSSALVAYENPESTRALNVVNVQTLADHYGVNAAWLLGQSDSWSVQQDIRQVCEMTGLSADAVMALRDLMADEEKKRFINLFLASREFSGMVTMLAETKKPVDQSASGTVDYGDALRGYDGGGDYILNERDYADMRLWKASREMEKLMREITEG